MLSWVSLLITDFQGKIFCDNCGKVGFFGSKNESCIFVKPFIYLNIFFEIPLHGIIQFITMYSWNMFYFSFLNLILKTRENKITRPDSETLMQKKYLMLLSCCHILAKTQWKKFSE